MMDQSICKPEIFTSIYSVNAEVLRNYLYYKFGDLETAEDIVQESFIKLWNNCAKVIYEKAKSYLFTIASNSFLDKKRRQKVVVNYQQQHKSNVDNQNPEFLMQEQEFMKKLQTTLSNLPNKQREVFLLNRIDKKTYKEIAEILNISVKAVEKRMHNALLIVRKEIGNI